MNVQIGICNWDGSPTNRAVIETMRQQLKCPAYFKSIFLDSPIAVGTLGSNEPYQSKTGNLIGLDGRLDNRDDLLRRLNQRVSNESDDIALVAAAFEAWGPECFSKFVGEWAIAIWELRTRTLFLARDYIGTKHLFYRATTNRVQWSSHLEALVTRGDRFRISDEYIAGYLAFYPSGELTPYEGISSVPPGALVSVNVRKQSVQKYWKFNAQPTRRFKSDADYEDEYARLFRQAVRRRLRADGRILAGLSGGLDSSSIVCMADDILSREDSGSSVDTFSYYDAGDPDESDFEYFDAVERWRGKNGFHANLVSCGDSFSVSDCFNTLIPGFIARLELRDAFVRLGQQCQYAAILSGVGGDEMNGQSLDPRVALSEPISQLHWREAFRQLSSWSLLLRIPLAQLLMGSLRNLLSLGLSGSRLKGWLMPEFAHRYSFATNQLRGISVYFWSPARRDASQTLDALARRMTYVPPSFLEHRYPFLDQEFVEFVTRIPLDQILRPGQRRSLMRRSLRNLLPPCVLARRTKAGAGRCYTLTVQKHWNEIQHLLADPLTAQFGYLEPETLRRALDRLKSGDIPFHLAVVLKALALEVWLRNVVARGIVQA
jgi:asparagine synthase (glutamine-hydrolysing)